jgi:uncharacterized protein (TIGR02145 family)
MEASILFPKRPARKMLLFIILLVTFPNFSRAQVTPAVSDQHSVKDNDGNTYGIAKMHDGKYWTTNNISTELPGSWCYDSLDSNCNSYGRLYTWNAALHVCEELGEGWRLPTDKEWCAMVQHYGRVHGDSGSDGKEAYLQLIKGGASAFNVMLGGGRDPDGAFRRMNAHGFFWTATESGDSTAWFYNFGKGSMRLFHQKDLEKIRAVSVRCVRDE